MPFTVLKWSKDFFSSLHFSFFFPSPSGQNLAEHVWTVKWSFVGMNSWAPRLHLLCKVFAHNKALLSVTFTALQLLALKIAVREGFVSREVCVPWASSSKCQCHLTPSSLLLPIPSQGCCVGCPGVLCGVSGGAVWGNCELRINSCCSELGMCPWYRCVLCVVPPCCRGSPVRSSVQKLRRTSPK